MSRSHNHVAGRRQHKPNNTDSVSHMIMDAKNMTRHELLSTYNVEVWEDGQVYDLTEDMMYPSVKDWANSTIEDDDLNYDDKYNNIYPDVEDFY